MAKNPAVEKVHEYLAQWEARRVSTRKRADAGGRKKSAWRDYARRNGLQFVEPPEVRQ